MAKAIQVKYIPATDTKPTRLKAWTKDNKSLVVSRDSLDTENPMLDLVVRYCENLGWTNYTRILSGGLPNGDDVFILDYSGKQD